MSVLEKLPEILLPMECHGVVFLGKTGDEFYGSCPFCGEDDHLYANCETGQWGCKKCDAHGNAISFLEKLAAMHHDETPAKMWLALSKARGGLPPEVFKPWGMGYDGEYWLIPVRSDKGTVRDIRRWNPDAPRMMATKGCGLQLWGMDRLAKAGAGKGRELWLCEGEWDAMALYWFLKKSGIKDPMVVAVPGASTFKKEWVQFFKDWVVHIMFDNDDAGDKGSARTAGLLAGTAKKIDFVNWPEAWKPGFDVRDFVTIGFKKNDNFPKHVSYLRSLVQPTHRRKELQEQATGGMGAAKVVERPSQIPTFSEVLATFKKWLRVDHEFRDALIFSLAVVVSEQMEGDPLWAYLIGPPGSGKTVIVAATQESESTVFRSSITFKELLSGYKDGNDPSLLPKLDKKVLVLKDGTEMLSLPQTEFEMTMSLLRGAYDGLVQKGYGNAVQRDYKLHFSMLVAVTPAINGCARATLGERFLKFQMMRHGTTSVDEVIMAALNNINRERRMSEELSGIVRDFLFTEITEPPEVPMWVKQRVVALSQLVSMLRAAVEKDRFSQDVLYRPQHEVGTRLAKQLVKLGMAIAVVLGKKVLDEEVFRLMERVASDTANAFHMDIINEIMRAGNGAGVTTQKLQERTGIPTTTLYRRLEDMQLLAIVEREVGEVGDGLPGRKPVWWSVSDRIAALWKQANMGKKGASKK